MSISSLEIPYAALFKRLQAVRFATPIGVSNLLTWGESSRRVKVFSAVTPDLQPAAYQAEYLATWKPTETPLRPAINLPPRRIVQAMWIVYFRTDFNQIGAIIAQQLMDAINVALTPDENEVLTLGRTVQWARIEGLIKTDPGDVDDQGQMLIPISMMVP